MRLPMPRIILDVLARAAAGDKYGIIGMKPTYEFKKSFRYELKKLFGWWFWWSWGWFGWSWGWF